MKPFFRTVLASCSLGLTMMVAGCSEDNAKVMEQTVPKDQLGGIQAKPATPTAPMVKGAITQDNVEAYRKATSGGNLMQSKGYPGANKR